MKNTIFTALFFVICFYVTIPSDARATELTTNYPRICNLNIGGPSVYDKPEIIKNLSKADIVLMGFYKTWENDRKRGKGAMTSTVRKIKNLNPVILIGQYTNLNEAPAVEQPSPDNDLSRKIEEMNWWLRDALGHPVQWTKKYKKYDVNLTALSTPDNQNKRYPQWLAQRDYDVYFSKVPEFDIWYLDNVFERPRSKIANWTGKPGDMQTAASVQTLFRQGHVAEWQAIRALKPDALLVGNVEHSTYKAPEYSNQLNGVVLEGLMGLKWSLERLKGWQEMMTIYHDAFAYILEPKIVVFNVHGTLDDYQTMRFGLSSSLMNNGFFSYSELNQSYQSIPWFDEFDADLGQPLDGPQTAPWHNGIYRREFEKGIALVNPTNSSVTVANDLNLVRLKGRQAPKINNGQPVGASLTIPPRDGLILLKAD